jgi:hypothetical protein
LAALATFAALTIAATPFPALAAIAAIFAALAASATFTAIAFAASTAFAASAAFAATAAAFAIPAIINGMKKGSCSSTVCCHCSTSSFNSFISRTIESFCSTHAAALSSSSFIMAISSIFSWSTMFSDI